MPMKSLADPIDLANTLQRLSTLRPDSARVWGRMTPHQMLCHLNDSYLVAMGERPAEWSGNPLTTSVLKWVALYAPLEWPKGVKTGKGVDQDQGGTRPVEFEGDRQRLEQTVRRFTAMPRDFRFARHPVFGEMSAAQWLRWGYLHADHHFRQFGV